MIIFSMNNITLPVHQTKRVKYNSYVCSQWILTTNIKEGVYRISNLRSLTKVHNQEYYFLNHLKRNCISDKDYYLQCYICNETTWTWIWKNRTFFSSNNHKDSNQALPTYENCLHDLMIREHTNDVALIPKCMEIFKYSTYNIYDNPCCTHCGSSNLILTEHKQPWPSKKFYFYWSS